MTKPIARDTRVQSLIDRIEVSFDSLDQQAAIEELSRIPGPDSGRALIECFQLSPWRSTRIQVLRALGQTSDFRVLEFLIRIASTDTDLPMAAEAVIALGNTLQPQAMEYLLGMLDNDNHPLQREVIIALSRNPLFPCDERLLALLGRSEQLAPSITQYLILALARRRCVDSWPVIRTFLDAARQDSLGLVFNAALIAAGLLGTRDDITFLRSLELRFRFFAYQLAQVAITQIELRCGSRVDDLATLMLASDTPQSRTEYLIAMRDYGYDLVRETILGIQGELCRETSLLLQTMFPHGTRIDEGLQLIAGAAAKEFPDLSTMVLKNVLRLDPKHGWERASRRLPSHILVPLLQSTAVPGCEALLTDVALDTKAPIGLRTQAVNSMVGQFLMRQSLDHQRVVGRLLSRVMTKADAATLRYRAIRALGQIGYDETSELATLSMLLKDDPAARPSIYSALGLMGSPAASRTAMKRLRVAMGKEHSENEVRACLKSVGEYGTEIDAALLARMTPGERQAGGIWLLRLLAQRRIEGFKATIKAALDCMEFRTKMLGVVAAGVSRDSELVARLFDLLANRNEALAGRALFAICIGGTPSQHLRLLQRALSERWDNERFRTLFESLDPCKDERYREFIGEIERWLATDRCPPTAEIRLLATNLCDNLRMLLSRPSEQPGRASTEPRTPSTRHDIDRELGQALPTFTDLSETIRSVLRNAELTYRHPNLFDSSVDKSTVIVEFVKSIDLFLQEKLGPAMFLRSGSELFIRLQSRIVQLQLDDETVTTAQRIRDLQCQSHYAVDDFPNHKLVSISRSIMSGKVLKDQYRVIDGPRAWAMLIVAFGRDFSFNGRPISAILPVAAANARQMVEISAVLNRLQEIRNQAAHRGTMLNQSEVRDIRAQSLSVLGQLTSILGA